MHFKVCAQRTSFGTAFLFGALPLLLVAVAVVAAVLVAAAPLGAQSVPTGFQEYFVIGYEQHVWEMLTRVQSGEGGPAFVSGMNSVVSATASADDQRIVYDHWEDGYEADLGNPVQASTLVIGDANPANGQACDFTTDPRIAPCDGSNDDVLFAGSFVNFESDDGLGCAAPPNDTRCSVPVNPRDPADVRFDGGDRLLSSGGPISLIHPQDPLSPFIGGATEIISRQAVEAARSYSIPIGEDIYGGNGSLTEPFKYVDVNIIAFDDATQVSIDSPGAGVVSFTLDRGEHYSSRGRIAGGPGPAITINAGTKISTTAPLAGLIFTGGDGTFATRFYTLLPDILHSTDYVITAPGDDPALQGSRPLNLYLFNPDPINPLDVTVTDSVGSTTFNIPANASVDYFTGTGRFVPTGSTVRMTSDRNFWGVSAYDHNSPSNDWGHSWLARKFVTANYTVSFAPGVNDPATQSQPAQRLANDPDCTIPPAAPGICDSINRSPVFVSATLDSTQVQVDFNNDGVFDVVDVDGDDFPDPAPLPGNTYVIDSLEALRIYDHTDYDNTGTLIVANKPLAVAYGQDTDQATGPDPIQDTGYTIYPIDQLFLDPSLVIEKTANPTIVPTSGGTVEYTLTVSSYDFGPLANLEVYDLLPPGVAGADYVPGSTLVTYPDLSQDFSDPTASIDATTGRDRLDWTLSPDSLAANRTLTVRYSVDIPPAPGGTARLLVNEGRARATLGSSVFAPLDTARVVQADLALAKSVDVLNPAAGDVLTFTLAVENAGLAAETNVVVSDPLPADTNFVPGSITNAGPFTGVFDPAQNAVSWSAASLPPGGPHLLTFQAQVNPGVPEGTAIANRAGYESNETPFFFSNQVEPVVIGPDLAIAKTGPAGPLRPNEVVTYQITVDNAGSGPATNVRIADPFPANASYVTGSMRYRVNTNPFAALTDASDADAGSAFVDRVEMVLPSLGAGEDLTFRFQVRVDPGTDGQFLNNQATVSADQVLPRDTNLVQAPIIGDRDVTGRVFLDLDGDGAQDPGEPGLADVDVVITDAGGSRRVVTDANGDWAATVLVSCYEDDLSSQGYSGSTGELDWSAEAWTEISTAGLADQDPATAPLSIESDPLGVFGPSLSIQGGPSPSNRGFTRGVDLSAAGFGQSALLSLSYRRESMEASDSVTLEIDYDGNGTFDEVLGNFPGSGGGGGTDGTWQMGNFALDTAQLPSANAVIRFLGTNFNHNSDHFYIDNVELCDGSVTANVDENDPDFPAGASLTTANDPQTIVTVAGATAAATPVGYRPLPMTFAKTSNAELDDMGNPVVSPGQVLTYTLAATNNTGITQTGVVLTDALPSGTLAVPGSTLLSFVGPGGNLLDDMSPTAYNGTDGSLDWSATPWTEFSNQGVDGNPAAGTILITADPLGVNGTSLLISDGPGGTPNKGVTRVADLSSATAATLSFDYRRAAFEGADEVTLEIDYGSGFSAVPGAVFGQPGGGTDGAWQSFSTNLDAAQLPNAAVTLRFRTTGGFSNGDDRFYLDNVEIDTLAEINVAGGDPPGLITLGDGISLASGETLTVTFDVRIDPNLAPGVTQITNSATLSTDFEGPYNAQVTDSVLRLAVVVEPNNAGFAVPGGTVTYTHRVSNEGQRPDSYDLRIESELGWRVELIDPDTGVTLATDTDGDGAWDGGVSVSTGTLTPNAGIDYRVRVTVPPGTPLGVEESTTLFATSDLNPLLFDFATDETTTVTTVGTGPVVVEPDHSGVVTAGGSIVYTHTVLNNTGVSDTFDLVAAASQPGWTARIYNDSNGDGVLTPGVDVQITNTLLLADGQQQTFFIEVEAPPGATAGDTDVTHLSAVSRNDPSLFDAASDTTTVEPPQSLDLSGGGTLLVTPGGVAIFPGTLKNKTDAADDFDFTISASPFFGLDGLPHPSELWLDTNGDGNPDTRIGEDSDGDGNWDFVDPAFDTNGDGNPDAGVAAGGQVAFEMRRPVDANQGSYRDPVTLTATSRNTGERDSVTPTNLLATATHALIGDFRVQSEGGAAVVEWETVLEAGTVGFRLLKEKPEGGFVALHRGLLPALQTAAQGGVYRFSDAPGEPGEERVYRLVEVDQRGAERHLGPFAVTVEPSPQPSPRGRGGELNSGSLSPGERGLGGEGSGFERHPHAAKTAADARIAPAAAPKAASKAGNVTRLRVHTAAGGLVKIGADQLAAAFSVARPAVDAWLRNGDLRLTSEPTSEPVAEDPCPISPPGAGGIFLDGFESGDLCAWSTATGELVTADLPWLPVLDAGDAGGLYFVAEEIDDTYAAENVYWLHLVRGRTMAETSAAAPFSGGGASFPETRRFEIDAFPATAVFHDPEAEDPDFWFWDLLVTGNPATAKKSFTVEAPGAVPGTSGRLRVELHGQVDAPDLAADHRVIVRWGTDELGTVVWDGTAPAAAEFELTAGQIAAGANQVELELELVGGKELDVVFLSAFELEYQRRYRAMGDVLEAPAAGHGSLTFEGFSRADVEVFEIAANRGATRHLRDVTIEPSGELFSVSFKARPGARYVALPLALASSARLEVDRPSNLRAPSNAGEYLILAGPGLEAAAEELAQLRRDQGLLSSVVRVQDVYDEWNSGLPSPWAIRDFLAYASARWSRPPRYVVLAGDSSFDYRNLLGADENRIPAPLRATSAGLFTADNRLADLVGGDGVPEIALGRLPVHNAAELSAYVAKLAAMESTGGAWRNTGVWVADDVDEGGEFLDDVESLAGRVPASFVRRDVSIDRLGAPAARQELLTALSEGARLVTYLGHGGLDRLADEGLLTTADAASLGNGPRQPVLTALTCAVGRFDLPGFDTLSETLVRQGDGGVAALWSPSGLSFNHEARAIGEAFYRAVYEDGQERLGDAVRAALAAYAAQGDGDPDLPFLFVLLGDPAIRLAP